MEQVVKQKKRTAEQMAKFALKTEAEKQLTTAGLPLTVPVRIGDHVFSANVTVSLKDGCIMYHHGGDTRIGDLPARNGGNIMLNQAVTGWVGIVKKYIPNFAPELKPTQSESTGKAAMEGGEK